MKKLRDMHVENEIFDPAFQFKSTSPDATRTRQRPRSSMLVDKAGYQMWGEMSYMPRARPRTVVRPVDPGIVGLDERAQQAVQTKRKLRG